MSKIAGSRQIETAVQRAAFIISGLDYRSSCRVHFFHSCTSGSFANRPDNTLLMKGSALLKIKAFCLCREQVSSKSFSRALCVSHACSCSAKANSRLSSSRTATRSASVNSTYSLYISPVLQLSWLARLRQLSRL